MKVYRIEESEHQRRIHGLDVAVQPDYAHGPRGQLAHEMRNAHRIDAGEHNARVDALADLSPREALAKEIAGMWKGVNR